MLTTLHFRAGKSAFGKFNNEYSVPMQPQLISHSAEMLRKYNESILNAFLSNIVLERIAKFTDSNHYFAEYVLRKT